MRELFLLIFSDRKYKFSTNVCDYPCLHEKSQTRIKSFSKEELMKIRYCDSIVQIEIYKIRNVTRHIPF